MSRISGTRPTESGPDGPPLDVLVVYGTRPEAVKMAPVIRALAASPHFRPVVAVSAQHREMLDQVHAVFGITPDFDLDLHRPGQTLTEITTRVLNGIREVLDRVRPVAVIVQGDTTTTFAAALAASYAQIPVVHLEAGLRSGDPAEPFPEEINRRLTSQLATLHLAPTMDNRANLLRENVDPGRVVVTGNTVIDALLWVASRQADYGDDALADLDDIDGPILLVTAHRRESWGEPMRAIGRAIADIAVRHPRLLVIFPIHANPLVREAVLPALQGLPNVRITEPLPYGGFVRLMARADIILTDSGGIQEEAPSLDTPVLVMRNNTERTEVIGAGAARLVGTATAGIVAAIEHLLTDPDAYAAMAKAENPYGDGSAAERGISALAHHFGLDSPAGHFTGVQQTIRVPAATQLP